MKHTLLAIAFMMAGCATTYQPESFSGGYSDSALGNNLYEVSFSGNGFTGSQTVKQFFLRRCAELTVQNGFEFFMLVDQNAQTSHQALSTNTSGTVQRNYYGGYDYTANSQTSSVAKHSREGIIKLLNKNEAPPTAFNARELLQRVSMGHD